MARLHNSCNKHKQKTSNKGFSLIELIVVIAIMAVLIGVLTPSLIKHIHKAKVASDWAKIRNYYDEIQADYTISGEYNPAVPDVYVDDNWYHRDINYLDGSRTELKAGFYFMTKDSSGKGYQIIYHCDKHGVDCSLSLGTNSNS